MPANDDARTEGGGTKKIDIFKVPLRRALVISIL